MNKLATRGLHRTGVRSAAAALIAAALLGGCVELPTAPTVAAMPSPYKPLDVFQADDQFCRGYAYQQVGGQTPGATTAPAPAVSSPYYYDSYYGLQYRYNVAYEQCMYSKGNQLPGYTPPAASLPPPR